MTASILARCTLVALALAAAAAAAGPGDVGTPAADFNLPELGGGTHTLSEHQGQVVFLAVIGYG
jgi:hypothetical protein